jgi:sugar phosphate isomerase/epimerase
VDLKDWKLLASPDPGRRRDAAGANAEYVAAVVAAVGVRTFLAVVIPEEPSRARPENFAAAVDGYGQLMQAIAPAGARVVLEGWPGQAPHYASLACTPADCRAFFKAVGSDALGVNFDPSHLIRMGIDPARFLAEFAPLVFHAHAKDTALLPDGLYEHGHTQQATFDKPHDFGGHAWRYALPGHGDADWPRLLSILADAGYASRGGLLSIEMEDEQFNGTQEGEQRGLVGARDFLAAT